MGPTQKLETTADSAESRVVGAEQHQKHQVWLFFPCFIVLFGPAFGTTRLDLHVSLFLKQTSIQSLRLVASKV